MCVWMCVCVGKGPYKEASVGPEIILGFRYTPFITLILSHVVLNRAWRVVKIAWLGREGGEGCGGGEGNKKSRREWRREYK